MDVPISIEDIAEADGENPEQRLFSAAIDFLRNEIAVKVEEKSDIDIINVFSEAEPEPELKRVYVQFRSGCKLTSVNSTATGAAQGRGTGQSQQSGQVNSQKHLNYIVLMKSP